MFMHTVSFPNYLHFFCPTKNNCWKIYEPFSPLCYCVKSPKNITYQDPIMWINFLTQKIKIKNQMEILMSIEVSLLILYGQLVFWWCC